MTQARRLSLLALALLAAGCGREELDLLVRAQVDEDPCLSLTSKSECDANVALGCSFQPNAEGCQSTDPSCQPGMCRGGYPFVRRVERGFFLHGDPFRFVGVASWALLPGNSCTGIEPDDQLAWMQQAYDELVPSRAKVARFFAFQSSAGPSGTDFALFDASVNYARRAGVRLQFVLEHREGSCSQGERRETDWYAGGHESPDGNYARSYSDFARELATRYRDEPTVLGYVLMQGVGGADGAVISTFVTKIGQLLHGVAPHHLVSLDLNWDPTNDSEGATFRALQELREVDLIDLDDYSFEPTLQPLSPLLLQTLSTIDKPVVVGEGAFLLESSDAVALVNRAERARERITQWRDWGFSGALLWAYQPGWGTASEEFDARPADPLLQPNGVLANAPW